MLKQSNLLITLLLVLFTGNIQAQSQRAEDGIDSLITGITKSIFQVTPLHTTFSYAVIQNGVVRFYGFKNEPIKTLSEIDGKDAVFEIGSISKVFTSILLSEMLYKKQVDSNATIGKYFGKKLKSGRDITLIQLANHSSRIPRLPSDLPIAITNPYKEYSYKQMIAYLQKSLVLQDSVQYDYSNLGVAVLEYCIAQESGKTYEAHLQELLFQPLKMTHSSTDIELIQKYLVQAQDSAGAPTANWDMNAFVGAGGIKSSVNDLSKLVLAYFEGDNPILQQTLQPTFNVNQQMFMGLGWHGIRVDKSSHWFFHNGGTNGYGSTILMDVEKKNAVIILTNLSAFNNYFPYIDKTAISIMKELSK